MSNYTDLAEDDDFDDVVDLNIDEEDDAYKIRIDSRFTKKSKKKKQKKSNRGHVKILLEEPPESPSFDGFDVAPYEAKESATNHHHHHQNEDSNAQFIIAPSPQNIEHNDTYNSNKNEQKSKKKKKKKYKTKKSDINLQPLSVNMNTNEINDSNNNAKAGEEMNENKSKKRKTKKRKKQKTQTRNERIREYIKLEIKWWLFSGTMMSLLVFAYSALNVGIAEDLILFYADYKDLICHFDVNGFKQEQRLIGNVLTHENVKNLFNSSAILVLLSLVGLIASFLLICFKENLKRMRQNVVVGIVYFVFFVICELVIAAWNVLILFDVMDELNAVDESVSSCVDESVPIVSEQENVRKEVNDLLNEFDVMFVLIVPLMLVFVCIGCFMKIKVS